MSIENSNNNSSENENLHDNHDIVIEKLEKPKDGNITQMLITIFEAVYITIFNYLRIVGINTLKIFKKITKQTSFIYNKMFKHHVARLDGVFLKILKVLKSIARFLMFKIYMFIKFFVDAKNVITNGYKQKKEKGIFFGLSGAIGAFFKGVVNNKSIFVTWFNYLLPVAAVFFFVFIIDYVGSLNFAVSVEYNGEHLGYIENENVFEQAEAKLQQRMVYLDADETIDNLPKFSLAVVPAEEIKDSLQITDSIIQSSNEDIVKATGMTIDGQFVGAVKDDEIVRAKLETKKNEYKTGKADEVVDFTKEIAFEPGLFISKNIKPEAEILELIDKETEQDVYVPVLPNDTPIMLAARNDMSVSELEALNPGVTEKFVVGQQILVNKSQPFLPVSVSRTETYTMPVPYTKEVTETSKYYKGYKVVTKQGEQGEKKITAKVEYVDNVEVDRVIVNETITKPAVNEQVTQGTGSYSSYGTSNASTTPYSGKVSASGFIWPVSGGYVSSPYGYRGRSFHTGIDIAFRGNGYGKPVSAVLPGKVVFAGWGNSYGKLIKIDHGGGVQTWYAHNSDISFVKVGQIVSQGQRIASVGSTGRSTGNHVHLEVRINGSTQNPRNYLS